MELMLHQLEVMIILIVVHVVLTGIVLDNLLCLLYALLDLRLLAQLFHLVTGVVLELFAMVQIWLLR